MSDEEREIYDREEPREGYEHTCGAILWYDPITLAIHQQRRRTHDDGMDEETHCPTCGHQLNWADFKKV